MSGDIKNNNPANEIPGLPKDYRPMSTATLTLEVPQRPGYHRHWFRGTPERIARAQQAGYRFVDATDETVDVNNRDLAGDPKNKGSTDLGSRVSVVTGDELTSDGQPSRLYLMECPLELFKHGQKILEERNDSIAAAIRGGTAGGNSGGDTPKDMARRYTKDVSIDLFTRKNRS